MADPVKTNAEIVGDGGLMPAWVSAHKYEPVRRVRTPETVLTVVMAYDVGFEAGQRDRDAAWLAIMKEAMLLDSYEEQGDAARNFLHKAGYVRDGKEWKRAE